MVQLPKTFPAAGIGKQEAEGWYWALSRPLGSGVMARILRSKGRLGCTLWAERVLLHLNLQKDAGASWEPLPQQEVGYIMKAALLESSLGQRREDQWIQCLSEQYQMVPVSLLPAPSQFLSYPKPLEFGSCGQRSGLCLLCLARGVAR